MSPMPLTQSHQHLSLMVNSISLLFEKRTNKEDATYFGKKVRLFRGEIKH